jgi:uncharacterized membrane protein YhaH (DUF805 family)
MKINKKKAVTQKSLARKQSDRMNFYIVIGIILLANLLLFLTTFPKLDDMAAIGSNPDAESRATFLKLTVIVVTDAFLFVILSMILSRRSAKRNK